MTLSVWATSALTGVRILATAMTVATIEFDLIQFSKMPNFPAGVCRPVGARHDRDRAPRQTSSFRAMFELFMIAP